GGWCARGGEEGGKRAAREGPGHEASGKQHRRVARTEPRQHDRRDAELGHEGQEVLRAVEEAEETRQAGGIAGAALERRLEKVVEDAGGDGAGEEEDNELAHVGA